jgi:CRISPR-associated endonuclease/helicase Cas3
MSTLNAKPVTGFIYANTQLQLLSEHLFAVGYVAEQLHKKLIFNRTTQADATFVAGCLHDIGKLDPQFQNWVIKPKKQNFVAEDGQHIDDGKFSFDKHPRHNEISALLYFVLDSIELKSINADLKKSIKHTIYWHHAKPFREDKDFDKNGYEDIYKKLTKNTTEKSFDNLFNQSVKFLQVLSNLDKEYSGKNKTVLDNIFKITFDKDIVGTLRQPLPYYKKYSLSNDLNDYVTDIQHNANNNIMRSCVITADRLISALSAEELHTHIKNKTLQQLVEPVLYKKSTLTAHIEQCLTSFAAGERSTKQSEVAHQLAELPNIAVLAGAAGCGKTKIALEWAKLKNAQQIIWVCPRVQVCQGLFLELITDQYLPNANIEINTGEYKFTNQWGQLTVEQQLFQGDVVITTIDQIFSAIISHTKADALIDFLNIHIVFDEFHEYVNMPAFNILFAELIACKKQREQLANTLLVSATPHYYFIEEFLGIDRDDIVVMPSFNQSLYQLVFQTFDETKQDERNPLYKKQADNTFVISNTAITAQKSFIRNQHNENAVLLHSKFKKHDKQKWFGEVYEAFKKGGTHSYNVLRSGPIVQASLNISCNYMVTELTNAENMLQRLGRLDRFGQNDTTNIYCVAVPETINQNKGTGASARFLARMNSFSSTKAWLKFLQSKLDNQPINLMQLYDIYKQFYQSNGIIKESIASDLIACLKKSVSSIEDKVFAPLFIPPKRQTETGRAKISKSSLRGDNRFVQMAMLNVNDPNVPQFIDQYAYEMPINDTDEIDNLTASRDQIEGYGDSNKNLLAHMMKKHHSIIGGTKTYKDFILLNKARDPEFPVYLSYTSSDLVAVGGENARHSEAIYYAVCDKQPIGAISIKKLTN